MSSVFYPSEVNIAKTPDNLKVWGSGLCPSFTSVGTIEHMLNFFPIALIQGRFIWRLKSVLNHLTNKLLQSKSENLEIFSDINGLETPSHLEFLPQLLNPIWLLSTVKRSTYLYYNKLVAMREILDHLTRPNPLDTPD